MSTQNIIQGIVSPKVVSDGTGGYQVKTDIVNVDNITTSGSIVSNGAVTGVGALYTSGGVTCTDINFNKTGGRDDPFISSNTGLVKFDSTNLDMNGCYITDISNNMVIINKGLQVNNGNIMLSGNVIHSNTQCGIAQLQNGYATLSNNSITNNSIILVTPIKATIGGTATQYSISIDNGRGFTINSSNGSDTSYVNWFIAKF